MDLRPCLSDCCCRMKKTTDQSGLGASGSKGNTHVAARSEAGDTFVELLIAYGCARHRLRCHPGGICHLDLGFIRTSRPCVPRHRPQGRLSGCHLSDPVCSQCALCLMRHRLHLPKSGFLQQSSYRLHRADYVGHLLEAPSSFSFGSSCAAGSTSPQLVGISRSASIRWCKLHYQRSRK